MTRSIYLIVMSILLGIAAGCGKGHETGANEKPTVVSAKDLTLVTVKAVSLPETVELSGVVRSGVSATVAARIPGTVAELRVSEGDRVTRGQTLARLEARETAASAAAASAAVEEAGRALNEARANRKLADSTFGRYEKLFTEQAVTRQEFETRQNEKELAAQGVARAEARLVQAREASRASASLAGHATITAPVAGIVTSRKVDPGSTVFPGQPLMTIESEGNYRLELTVPESLSPAVRPGMPVRVSVDSLASGWNARISEVVPAADPGSRTFVAKVPLNVKNLKSGLFGRVGVELPTRGARMLLPRRAIVEQGGLTSVRVVGRDNRVGMRLVKPGRSVDDRVEILSGLEDGERVVVDGLNRVSEGTVVQ